MTNKIMFGADLIKVLEKEYKLNKLGEVPTKYKNGVTTIDFIYGKEKNIDDLKYDKPYIEFTVDDETDGFISGTMYPNGGVEGIQFDSWEDLKYFMKNAKWTESKKFVRKSLKERDDAIFSKDVKRWMLSGNDINITFKDGNELVGAIYEHRKDAEDKKAECFLCEDLTADYTGQWFIVEVYNGKISEIKFQSYDWLEHYMDDSYDLMESKKSLKESTDESFSLYDLNKHDPFVKEWVKNINKELDVSIESIGDDEIVFRVWFDENIDLDIFDDIATDCMPSLLIEFMSDMNIDFNYQFVYADDKFTENDYVFIRFVAW
jgi:hypothetical protein